MTSRSFFPQPAAVKVPRVSARFWAAKFLVTAAGVATSECLARGSHAAGAAAEIALLAAGLTWQLHARRYHPAAYWLLAYALAAFATGLASGLHQVIGVSHNVTAVLWSLALILFCITWQRRHLSTSKITTRAAEAHYWAMTFTAITFSIALADYTAISLHVWSVAPEMVFLAAVIVPTVDFCLS